MNPIEIQSPNLLIRDFEESDWVSVQRYGSDPDVIRFMPWGPSTDDERKEFIKGARSEIGRNPRRAFDLAVVRKEDNDLIGGIRITVQHVVNRNADIGYVLRRDQWGRGYAREAAAAILKFGFEELRMHRIYAIVAPANVASIKVLEAIGMKREGLLREHQLIHGQFLDALLYSKLETD